MMVAQKKISGRIKETHLQILRKAGEDGLCKYAVSACSFGLLKQPNLEIEVLDLSEAFLSLYRRSNVEEYLVISRALRRAAHIIYWGRLKKTSQKLIHAPRFLTAI